MLASSEAGRLLEWAAYFDIEPFGNEWERSSWGATAIVNEVRGIAAGLSGKSRETEFMDPDDLVPGRVDQKLDEQLEKDLEAIANLEAI